MRNICSENINFVDWETIPYAQAYQQQKELFEKALQNKAKGQIVENTVVFCEHPPVITLGKNGLLSNLLFPETVLKEKNVEWYRTDRGGDITYHGPGQIVCYPILDLETIGLGLKEYIYRLEEAIICTLAEYGIRGERVSGATGVWIDKDTAGRTRKIAAIGVRSSRYVTMHGFAFNVNTNLSYFRLIHPCGFTDKGVTSLAQELGHPIALEPVKIALKRALLRELFEINTTSKD
ncbi:MAG: lipoyl(octanoyl) transferase LipB [Candidatus Azobacteroides sp.]|nr:lipoyl(octanoyl) transferase LipB [Candidatus Azobacteroides sp.]